jgi:hypothetical protein
MPTNTSTPVCHQVSDQMKIAESTKLCLFFKPFFSVRTLPVVCSFSLYLATFKSYIIMTLNNERKLGTYVPSAFLFGQQIRPGGTFSNQVGTSLCKGQLISECPLDVFNFPKKTMKKFDKFLHQNPKNGEFNKTKTLSYNNTIVYI